MEEKRLVYRPANKESEKRKKVIEKLKGLKFIRVDTNEVLAVRNLFLNPDGYYHFKYNGWRVVFPWQDAEIISTDKIDEPLKNELHSDGKFRLNGGLGEDIELKVSIAYNYIDDEESMNTLLQQQNAYAKAGRILCEDILGNKLAQIVASGKFALSMEDDHANLMLAKLQQEFSKIDLDEIITRYLDTGKVDSYEAKMAESALKLSEEYGIQLSEIKVTDIDFPKKIKEVLEKEKIAAKERGIKLADAETNIKISKLNAVAKISDMKERIKYYLDQGYSKSEIYEMEKLRSVSDGSGNATIVYQANNNDRLADVISGATAAKSLGKSKS